MHGEVGRDVFILWEAQQCGRGGGGRPPPGPGSLSGGGRYAGEGSLGECNDNSSARPRFVRGNKITSQNKYYLCYSLKKGKLMPRHHA